MSTPNDGWSYSTDNERFNDVHETREEAIAMGFAENPEAPHIYVGECEKPDPACVDADDIIDAILSREAFETEWSDDWPSATKEQKADLTENIQRVITEWIARHHLEPWFFTMRNSKRVTREEAGL